MSLLSGLLHHLKSNVALERSIIIVRPAPIAATPLMGSIEHGPATSPHLNAATATPEWRQTRDQYLNHITTCTACHSPTSRYCLVGVDLRASYNSTHMETLK